MKKMLLSAALLIAAFSANAQEIVTIDGTTLGLNADAATEVAAGTEIGRTASGSVVATTLYTDKFKCVGMKKGTVSINGTQVSLPDGAAIQGSTNVSGSAASEGTYPTTGCAYRFTVSQDGYLYLIISASGNKNYVVFEEETSRMPYIFSMENSNGGDLNNALYYFDLSKMDGATYYDEEIGDYYVSPDFAIQQPSQIITGESVSTTGNGVIKFKVYADCKYDAMATGSKMTIGAFAFDTTGDADVITDTNTLLVKGQIPDGTTGITEVNTEKATDANAPAYNLAGQRVNRNAKGIVIVNGKKYINNK